MITFLEIGISVNPLRYRLGIFRQTKLLLAFRVKGDLAIYFFHKLNMLNLKKLFTKY